MLDSCKVMYLVELLAPGPVFPSPHTSLPLTHLVALYPQSPYLYTYLNALNMSILLYSLILIQMPCLLSQINAQIKSQPYRILLTMQNSTTTFKPLRLSRLLLQTIHLC